MSLPIKILVVAVVTKNSAILMRKKPQGSPPYVETWYLFGGEVTGDNDPDQVIKQTVLDQAGIEISPLQKFSWDTEIKNDLDGIKKHFVYLDVMCEYVSGDLKAAEGIEKLEWVEKESLQHYDIVPPSVILFKKLNYL